MEADLIARLKAVTGVTDLVSTRVYGVVPQGATYPLIRLQRIGSEHHHHAGGAAGVVQALVQIDCIGRLMSEAKNVAEQVRLALQGWDGTQGDTTFQSVLLTDQRDLEESDQQGGELGHFGVSMDFTVTYQESIPSFS